MNRIIIITDYKNRFGSKWDAVPYNSGMKKKNLEKYFLQEKYEAKFIQFSEVKNLTNVENIPIIYTSSEDIGYHYKDYIEDIIFYLECKDAIVIPSYKYLRANNNKVFMELLRDIYGKNWKKGNVNYVNI